jgi:hypothetical protein
MRQEMLGTYQLPPATRLFQRHFHGLIILNTGSGSLGLASILCLLARRFADDQEIKPKSSFTFAVSTFTTEIDILNNLLVSTFSQSHMLRPGISVVRRIN